MITYLLSKYMLLTAVALLASLGFLISAIKIKEVDIKVLFLVLLFFSTAVLMKLSLDTIYIATMPKETILDKYYGEY